MFDVSFDTINQFSIGLYEYHMPTKLNVFSTITWLQGVFLLLNIKQRNLMVWLCIGIHPYRIEFTSSENRLKYPPNGTNCQTKRSK